MFNDLAHDLYKRFLQLLCMISPVLNNKVAYLIKNKKPLDLKDPKSFSEKLIFLKLYHGPWPWPSASPVAGSERNGPFSEKAGSSPSTRGVSSAARVPESSEIFMAVFVVRGEARETEEPRAENDPPSVRRPPRPGSQEGGRMAPPSGVGPLFHG